MQDQTPQHKEHSEEYKRGFEAGTDLIFDIQASAEEREDSEWRGDIDARRQAVAFIDDLGRLLMSHARQIADAKDTNDPLEVDELAADLLWLSLEFVTQATCTTDFREGFVQPHQMTPIYTRWHYDLNESEGE